MKSYTTLYTGEDGKSHFKEEDPGVSVHQPLGDYSRAFPVNNMMFRTFSAGLKYDWHTAPEPQYIIYLEGEVEVQASNGEKRIFKSGDVLFATDTEGKGHITKTLTSGRSLVITSKL